MIRENTKKIKKCAERKFSFETVRRLNLYLRNMRKMKDDGVKIISSNQKVPTQEEEALKICKGGQKR